jgi:hypothetical protein
MKLEDFEATYVLPAEIAREVTYYVWVKRAQKVGGMPESAPEWVRERWTWEQLKADCLVGPLVRGAREYIDRVVAASIKGES